MLEEEAVKNKDIMLVYWEKSGRYIKISYRSEDDTIINDEVRLIDIRDNDELIVRNRQGKEYSVKYNDVVIDWTAKDYK